MYTSHVNNTVTVSLATPHLSPVQSGCGGNGRLERSQSDPGHTLQGLACWWDPTAYSHPVPAPGCCDAVPGRRGGGGLHGRKLGKEGKRRKERESGRGGAGKRVMWGGQLGRHNGRKNVNI